MSEIPFFDVAVVGGGASSAAFLNFINPSLSVVVIDKRNKGSKKTCSGVLVKEARFVLDSLVPSFLEHGYPLNSISYKYPSQPEKNNFAQKRLLNVCREGLDLALFERAFKRLRSVEVKNASVSSLSKAGQNFKVSTSEEDFLCRYAVDCSGATSFSRELFEIPKGEEFIGVKTEFNNDFEGSQRTAYFIQDRQFSDLYGWIIPSKDQVEAGLIVKKNVRRRPIELLREFLKRYTLASIEGCKFEVGKITLPSSSKNIYLGEERRLVCGEAAGLISPSSAEGISFALHSGMNAAFAINNSQINPCRLYEKMSQDLLERVESKFTKIQ